MGYELRRMIRDGAPRDWTALMRLVAGEIADDARDPAGPYDRTDPQTWPWSALPLADLAAFCGATERGISDALTRLGRAGYEMREPVTIDARGRLMFAVRGHAVRFRVPPLPPRSTHPSAGNGRVSTHPRAGYHAVSTHPRAGYESTHHSAPNGDSTQKSVPSTHPSASPSPQVPSELSVVLQDRSSPSAGGFARAREDDRTHHSAGNHRTHWSASYDESESPWQLAATGAGPWPGAGS